MSFVQEPETQPWGTFAILEDSEGNHLLLVERPADWAGTVHPNVPFLRNPHDGAGDRADPDRPLRHFS